MNCPECNRLRWAWYATATPIKTAHVSPVLVVRVRDADRKRADYQQALAAYREHRQDCRIARATGERMNNGKNDWQKYQDNG